MVDLDTFRKMALSFPEAEELPHFERPSFRVKKKIFATMWTKEYRAVLKLSLINQSVFSSFDKTIIHPIEGGWGRQGWTVVELRRVRKAMFMDALTTAWCDVAPKKLVTKFTERKK
jgi:hypothetical protein